GPASTRHCGPGRREDRPRAPQTPPPGWQSACAPEASGLPRRRQRAVAAEPVTRLTESLREQDEVLVVVGRRVAVEAVLAGLGDARLERAAGVGRRDGDERGVESRWSRAARGERARIDALGQRRRLLQFAQQAL